jgi:DNA repair exonuclease SbcCD ATPase subunit
MELTALSGGAGPAPVELIVQNGRLRGSCRPLQQPLTLVGRAAGCDVRLNSAGVSPQHCALVLTPQGLLLRVLPHNATAEVNGQSASNCLLKDGDLLAIGPFQFQVRVNALPAAPASAEAAELAGEKEALRVQAAAVAAQQTALSEEEARLQQRRQALDQQEEQLAKHLEEKRQRLIEVRDQAREAYTQLRNERKLREAQLVDGKGELLALRREVEDGRGQLRVDRQRLLRLRRRLKRRWHSHWAAERAAMARRDQQVEARLNEVQSDAERLQQERQAVRQARLAFNGEMEMGRRQLQAAWAKLRQARRAEDERQVQAVAELADRQADLERRAATLTEAERTLNDELHQWQTARGGLEKESVGLENRVRNYRRKISDHTEELLRLEAQLLESRAKAAEAAAGQAAAAEPPTTDAAATGPATEGPAADVATEKIVAASEPAADSVVQKAILPVPVPALRPLLPPGPAAAPAELQPAAAKPAEMVPEVALSLSVIERLAGELADQRLHLMEQCQRLVESQRRWHHNRNAAAAELETLGRQLATREQSLQAREEALEAAEVRVRQLHREATNLQRYLEGWQTRMTARETTWETDRERLLADIQVREKLAEQQLQAIDELHQRWKRRRHREVEWLKTERTTCEKLRHECAGLRDGWVRRQAALEQEQRALAEKSLAMEQLQQESLGQSADAAAAGRRLERLRRRWAALSAAAEKSINEQRQTLQDEAARLEALQQRLHKQSLKISEQEADFRQRLSEWEQKRLVATEEIDRTRQQLASAQVLRDRYEKQVIELRDEVERLARMFLDDTQPLSLPKAA